MELPPPYPLSSNVGPIPLLRMIQAQMPSLGQPLRKVRNILKNSKSCFLTKNRSHLVIKEMRFACMWHLERLVSGGTMGQCDFYWSMEPILTTTYQRRTSEQIA